MRKRQSRKQLEAQVDRLRDALRVAGETMIDRLIQVGMLDPVDVWIHNEVLTYRTLAREKPDTLRHMLETDRSLRRKIGTFLPDFWKDWQVRRRRAQREARKAAERRTH